MTAGPVIFRVYEITFDDGFVGRVAMSALRELSFRQEIASGERTGIVSMRLLTETTNRNEARAAGWWLGNLTPYYMRLTSDGEEC